MLRLLVDRLLISCLLVLLLVGCRITVLAQEDKNCERVSNLRPLRVTVSTFINPRIVPDVGVPREFFTERQFGYPVNLNVDVDVADRFTVSVFRYSRDFATTVSRRLTKCIVGHVVKISGLALGKRLQILPKLSLHPSIAITHTQDILSFVMPFTCPRPVIGGTSLGVAGRAELRWDVMHGINISAVTFYNNAVNNNIRHFGISPAISISF
jgi:hypothetical protein